MNARNFGTLLGCLFALAAAPATENSSEEVAIVIGDEPILGRVVLPFNDNEFRLRLRETDDVVAIRWAQLEPGERSRIRRQLGIETREDRIVFGRKLKGVRWQLGKGKAVEGLRVPEQDKRGQKAIRTASIPLMLVPESEIRSEEPCDLYESEVYSAAELFEQMLFEKPPSKTLPDDHINLAKTAARMGLFREALRHVDMACIIDERCAASLSDLRAELQSALDKQVAMRLYVRLLQHMRAESWLDANELLARLDRTFPRSDLRSRWDTVRLTIVEKAREELKRKIVPLFYSTMSQEIEKRYYKRFQVDEHGYVLPAVPGKQVTTRTGDVFKGELLDILSSGDMRLRLQDMTKLTIRAKEIYKVADVDLAIGAAAINADFEMMKTFIADAGPTGLKRMILRSLSQRFGVEEAFVADVFDTRRDREAVYEDGKLTSTQGYASIQTASYGIGSWLRNSRNRRLVVKQPAEENETDEGDEPERIYEKAGDDVIALWWKEQSVGVHLQILRAMAAERIFHVRSVKEDPCATCAGGGTVQDGEATVRCPACQGAGHGYTVTFE
ncbi:MAG TPA: hypothetical protein VEJ63_13600 [Planctomycetota bacterium]|nr:hypothetical protein [Planctomycetota bacterium]